MEDDIFNSGFEKFLSSIFKDRLMKSNKVQTINDLENLGYFGIDEIVPNNNFMLTVKVLLIYSTKVNIQRINWMQSRSLYRMTS